MDNEAEVRIEVAGDENADIEACKPLRRIASCSHRDGVLLRRARRSDFFVRGMGDENGRALGEGVGESRAAIVVEPSSSNEPEPASTGMAPRREKDEGGGLDVDASG